MNSYVMAPDAQRGDQAAASSSSKDPDESTKTALAAASSPPSEPTHGPASTTMSASASAPAASNIGSSSSAIVPPTVVEAWAAFDLTGRRENLDAQALEIAGRQEASTISRKKLATSTKEFKKALGSGNATNKQTSSLLKAYQGEVDALTQRAKAAEANFLVVYRALYDAPDPVTELRAAIDQRTTSAELREERAATSELAALAKKHEARVAELEQALVKAEESTTEEVRKALDAKQQEWMSAQHKAIEAYELREQELLHQISLGNKSNRSLKAQADRAQQQANEALSTLEDVKKARQVESEMVVEDLQKARDEADSLRRRCAELEERMQNATEDGTGEGGENGRIGAFALSAELAARDVELSQLRDQVSALEGVLGGKDAEKSTEFAKLTETIRAKDTTIGTMRAKLDKLPTVDEYETLKRQYETLRSFQLNEADTAEEEETEEAGSAEDALERRLLAKVKALEGKLTRLKMELVDRDGQIAALGKTNAGLEEQVADHKTLISRLEDGINAMTGDAGSRGSRKAAVDASQSEASADDWDWGEQREAAGLSRIMQTSGSGAPSLEPSMLDIVSGQRDRFRARTLELEAENRKLVERMDKVSADMDALKGDNVRLYGKIRFVQNYRGGSGAAPLAAAEAGVAGPEDSEHAAVLGRYRKMYEDMSNPYTLFSRRERHKRLSEMSGVERLTMRAGQRAMASRTGRLVAFSYVLALHLLVVLSLSTAQHAL